MSQIGRITVLCGMFIGCTFNTFASTTSEQIYQFARRNDVRALSRNMKDLNALNETGDTALCSAIKAGDVRAYNVLKNIGADTHPACIDSIEPTKYNKFMVKVTNGTHKTFLGLGKWGWGAIGAGVLGGAVIAASSGGGAGGSGGDNSSTPNIGSNEIPDDTGNDNTNKSCQELGYSYKYSDACPDGWIKNSGDYCNNNDGTGVWFKCNIPYTCPANYSIKCADGYEEVPGNICLSGDKVYKYCVKTTCPYTTISCSGGYKETGNTCRSGNTLYKECQPVQCGEHGSWSEQGCVCSEGWTGALCNIAVTCPYTTTTCPYGHIATGATCKSGDMVYKECTFDSDNYIEQNGNTYEKMNCVHGEQVGNACSCENGWSGNLCDTPTSCPYTTTSCTNGYHESGNTCMSGTNVYKECELNSCPYTTTECSDAYTYTGNTCQSGERVYKECKPIACGSNATWNETGCQCNHGYEKWEFGSGCSPIAITCGLNAIQQETECVCNFGYEGDPYTSCSLVELQCGHGHQEGTRCICDTGYGRNGAGICVIKDDIKIGSNVVNDDYSDIIGIDNSTGYKDNNNDTVDIINRGDGDIIGFSNGINNAYSEWLDKKAIIKIDNRGDGTVKGIKSSSGKNAAASGSTSTSFAHSNGRIEITNVGDGNVYGIDSSGKVYNSYGVGSSSESTAEIEIKNIGNGDVYGLVANDYGYNAYSYPNPNSTVKTTGFIKITNSGDGNAYGIYGETNKGHISIYNAYGNGSYGNIKIENTGNGNAYGMFGKGMNVYNTNENASLGYIWLINNGTGNAYGMYGAGTVKNDSVISIYNNSSGLGVGMCSETSIENSGQIHMINLEQNGLVIGMVGANIKNTKEIDIKSGRYKTTPENVQYFEYANAATGVGIRVVSEGRANNSGTITIDGFANAYGIYAEAGAQVTNSGEIRIGTSNNPIVNSYGIYAESGAIVKNTGTISINGHSCRNMSCSGSESYGNHIVLNGASLVNGGTMSASAFDFDSMNGNVVATNGAQFIAENDISGTLNLSSDIVTDGFNTTYVAQNMIQAGDTSKLNLRSGSAMFDAKLADNGNDVVMTMKSFDTLTNNKSLAAYLADNYAKGTSAEFFGGLKSSANMAEFNNILNGLSGLNAFTQFDREDMSAMREINFSMNQQMFMNGDRDEYQVSGSMEHFSFSNSSNGGSGSYGISNSRMSDNWKLGYGLAMASIGTNDDFGTSRSNQIGLFYMPMTYTNDNIEFISTPRVGFAKSHYSRRGYNNLNYDGYIEKQIFGFYNDLRYPVTFGNWTIAPDLGFNAIMYRQSGHESDQAFSLIIPADEIYSLEAGLGLFTKYERKLDNGSLRFNSGVMLYRELADTYNMKLGILGLDGTFNLYDDAEHDYSGAATFGFDYKSGRFSLYSNAQYFIDGDHYMNLKSGIRYWF